MEPNEISKREFLVSLRGYDRDEVDAFAKEVAQELTRLRNELAAASASGPAQGAPIVAAPVNTKAYERVGEDTSKILLAAEQVGEQIREKARREAAELTTDARAEAEKIKREADVQRKEAEDDLRKLREARTVLATQLEDVGQRLAESVARLRAPVEAAGPPSAKPATATPPLAPAPPKAAPVAKAPEPAPAPVAKAPEPAPTPAPTKAPPKTEDEGASLERLLQQIRAEREEGRKEVEAALKSEPPPTPTVKAPESSAPPVTPEPKTEPAPTATVAKPISPAPTDGGMLARRAGSLGEVPEQASRRLKRLLQEDQNDLLDRVRTQRGKGSVEENVIPESEHIERFRQGLDDSLRMAFATGRTLGGATDPGDATSAIASLVSKQVVGPLRVEISKTIAAGLQGQESANSLGERASDVFRVWKGVRTELLGEGMVYAAFHQGLVDAWKSAGQKEKKWVLSSDELECPKDVCKANAAAGAVALEAGFPSGHLAPPAHGGCSCTLEGPKE